MRVMPLDAGVQFDRGAGLSASEFDQVVVEELPVALRSSVPHGYEVVDVEDPSVVGVAVDAETCRSVPLVVVPEADQAIAALHCLLEAATELFGGDVVPQDVDHLQDGKGIRRPGMYLEDLGVAYDPGSLSTATSSRVSELPSPAARMASSSPVLRVR